MCLTSLKKNHSLVYKYMVYKYISQYIPSQAFPYRSVSVWAKKKALIIQFIRPSALISIDIEDLLKMLFAGSLDGAWLYAEAFLLAVWHNRLYVYTAAALLTGLWLTVNMTRKKVRTQISVFFYVCGTPSWVKDERGRFTRFVYFTEEANRPCKCPQKAQIWEPEGANAWNGEGCQCCRCKDFLWVADWNCKGL